MKNTKTLIFLLFLIFNFKIVISQNNSPTTKAKTHEIIDGKMYLLHTVTSGQTLYSIANLYGVDILDLKNINKIVTMEIKVGQVIRIPLNIERKKENHSNKTEDKKIILHKVLKGETIYSISNLYNITQDELLNLNPIAKNGLKVDLILSISINKVNDKSNQKESLINQQNFGHNKNNPSKDLNIKKENVDNIVEFENNILGCHKIEKGETFYSFLETKNLNEQEVKEMNFFNDPSKLYEGEFLLYPINIDKVNSKIEFDTTSYVVKNGETLYSISLKNNKSINWLKKINNLKNERLFNGQKLNMLEIINCAVFKKIEIYNEKLEIKNCDSLPLSTIPVNISMLLPIHSDVEDIKSQLSVNEIKEYEFQSNVANEVLLGTFFALSKINSKYKLNIKIFDTKNDYNEIKNILSDEKFLSSDLVFGPLSSSKFEILKEFSNSNNVPIIFPIPTQKQIEIGFRNSLVAITPIKEEMEYLKNYILSNFKGEQLFIIKDTSDINWKDDQKLGDIIKELLDFSDTKIIEPEMLTYEYFHKYYNDKYLKMINSTSNDKEIWCIFPELNKAEISNVLNKLNFISDSFNINLFGLSYWYNYENLDLLHLQNLRTTIPINVPYDTDEEIYLQTEKEFAKIFGTIPSRNTLVSFDIFNFVVTNYLKYGSDFLSCVENKIYKNNFLNFKIRRSSQYNGFINSYIDIYRFENYKLKKIESN